MKAPDAIDESICAAGESVNSRTRSAARPAHCVEGPGMGEVAHVDVRRRHRGNPQHTNSFDARATVGFWPGGFGTRFVAVDDPPGKSPR